MRSLLARFTIVGADSRRTSILSVLLLVLGALSVFVNAQSASASLSSTCKSSGYTCVEGGCNSSTMNNNWATKYYGSGGGVSIGNPPHNCTLYAAWMLAKNGAPNPGRSWGNASNWGHALASLTNGTPTVGSIAWYDAGRSGVGSSGHVGYVAQVTTSNGTVFIESDNYMGGSAGYTSSGWVPISSPSGYIHIKDLTGGGASSATQMILDTARNVWAKTGVGAGGWTEEVQGGMTAIATGGGVQMILDTAGNVWAKTGVGAGGWTEEVQGGMTKIAVGSDGTQMILDTAGNVWAKTGVGAGGWTQEVSGGMTALAAG